MKRTILTILSVSLAIISPIWAASEGDPAPICNLRQFNSDEGIQLQELEGKVVYMDFWASWCPPCKLSFPKLNELHKEFTDKGFEVVAVNLDEEKEDAVAFLADHPVDFAVARDSEGVCPGVFEVMAMPSAFIIDKQGKIRKVHLGFKEDDVGEIRDTVLALINE
ncbi:MAG: TlpA family protein disulfide reductase [Gammaproteobacteria bacterium]